VMGEPSALEKRSKRTLAKIGEVNQAARLRSEDEALVPVEPTVPQLLLCLPRPVAPKGFDDAGSEPHVAAALLSLRLSESELTTVVGARQGSSYPHGGIVEVNVLPLEPQQLPAPHAGVEGQHVEGSKAVSSFVGRILRGLVLRAFRLDRTAGCVWQVLDGFAFGASGPTRCFSEEPDHYKECPDGTGDEDEQVSHRDAQSSDTQRGASFRVALRASSYTQHTQLLQAPKG
jgi:hypothetical protein